VIVKISLILFVFMLPAFVSAGTLTSVTAVPQDSTVSEQSTYTISFTTANDPASAIPAGGHFRFTFPYVFNLENVILASSADQSTLSGGLVIDKIDTVLSSSGSDSLYRLMLGRENGSTVLQNSNVSIYISEIGNPAVAGNYTVFVETFDYNPAVLDTGTTQPFAIVPVKPINSFDIDVSASTSPAGQGFYVNVTNAVDVDGKPASGTINISFNDGGTHFPPDGNTAPILNPVVVTGGSGSAQQVLYKAESSVVLKGTLDTDTGVTSTTSGITITPGSLNAFDMIGYPSATTAGQKFSNNVTVTAQDPWQNIKTDYAGSIYFTSSDAQAVLTYNSGNPTTLVNGTTTLGGSNFELRTAGAQTITVTDGTVSEQSTPIQVSAADITSFSFSVGTSQVAGTSFPLSINSAQDDYGNAASGLINITTLSGGGDAPNGQSAILNAITVTDGTGSASQTLFKAESGVVLRGTDSVSGHTKDTPSITVSPNSLVAFSMTGYPTTTVAGQNFGSNDVTVTALDNYENVKTDYSGSVYFTSSDANANFTYNSGNPSSLPNGTKIFSGTDFTLKTTGSQTITVTNGTVSEQSAAIQVSTAPIVSFDLSAATSQVAGQSFVLTVTNAVDSVGNPTSGQINISAASGGGTAPNGQAPIFNSITVSDGGGSALQTLFKAESGVILHGVAGSGATKNTSAITVSPGDLAAFDMSGYPAAMVAGETFGSNNVTVTARDQWQNQKTDFSGSIYFESTTDPQAELFYNSGNPTTLTNGTETFSGSVFNLKTAGLQTITVKSGSIFETSSGIQVSAAAIASFSLSVNTTQTAGQAFNLSVSSANDAFLNPASGTVVVSVVSGGGNAPNGQPPTLTDIPVNDGGGSAAQTLVKAEATVLRGTSGSVVRNTPSISVLPGNLARLDVSGLPTHTTVGAAFPDSVVVTAYDGLENAKFDYMGTIDFSSTDPLATLPVPFSFDADSSQSFPGSSFSLSTPGTQTITVRDQAAGVQTTSDDIAVNSIKIVQITSSFTKVSQGQTDVPVTMQVENQGDQPLYDVHGSLNFKSGATPRDGDYTFTGDTLTALGPGQTANLTFNVSVQDTAKQETVSIDGSAIGTFSGQAVTDDASDATHSWLVQQASNVAVASITMPADSMAQGQSGIQLETHLSNNLGSTNSARANNVQVEFKFFFNGSNVSNFFSVSPNPINSESIAGGAETDFLYTVAAAEDAPVGTISISEVVTWSDSNSSQQGSTASPILETFELVVGSKLTITDLTPSQPTVTQSQDSLWKVTMAVRNGGGLSVDISFASDKTYILFKAGSIDYTPTYTIEQPTQFVEGGTSLAPSETKHIDFLVRHVGSQTGNIPIIGWVETTAGAKTNSNSDGITSGIIVQTPENVYLPNVLASQNTATVGDNAHPWTVRVPIENRGGSEIVINFDSTALSFSQPAGFSYTKPGALLHHGNSLKENESDTLVFTITGTGTTTGDVNIGAKVHYTVVNTNEAKSKSSATDAVVTLQTPSDFNIVKVDASQKIITAGANPDWWVTVHLTNESGGSDVQVDLSHFDSTWVRFYKDDVLQTDFTVGMPTALEGAETKILAAGARDSLVFPVTAVGSDPGDVIVRGRIAATELNRDKAFSDSTFDDRADTVVVQSAAAVSYIDTSLLPKTVAPATNVDFKIDVQNTGQSTVELNADQTSFSFSDGVVTFTALLDPSFSTSLLGGKTTTLHFRRTYVPSTFTLGNYVPQVLLKGSENGTSFQSSMVLADQVVVGEPGELVITSLEPETKTVTIGQGKNWVINIGVQNNNPDSVRLDSARITFYDNTQEVSQYFIVENSPDTLASGSRYLQQGETDTLRLTVDSVAVNAPLGRILLGADIWMTDALEPSHQLTGTVTNINDVFVQQPAQLSITKFNPSQNTVTRGQQKPWSVALHVKNDGESALHLISDSTKTFIKFSKPDSDFTISYPTAFAASGGLELAGGAEDSVLFVINKVDSSSSLLGAINIQAHISTVEMNTDRVLIDSTESTTGPITVTIQDSAVVRLDSIFVDVPSDSFVNKNQEFYIKAKVANPAAGNIDEVQQVTLNFVSKFGHVTFPNGSTITVDSIGPGETKISEPGILVRAPDYKDAREVVTAEISASKARNTGEPVRVLAPVDSSAVINIQEQGNFVLQEVKTFLTKNDTVPSGTASPWEIHLLVANTGEGAILLKRPDSADVSINQQGYIIKPASTPWVDSLLTAGDVDTLVYVVQNTPTKSGEFTITARARATDYNEPDRGLLQQTKQKQFWVTTTSAVRITKTEIDTTQNNVDAEGVGHVNIRQKFYVQVQVKNEGGQDLDSVKVKLQTQLSAITDGEVKKITDLRPGRTAKVTFEVKADAIENLAGETLKSAIVLAKGIDGSNADVLTGLDTTAIVKIYRPASLRIISTRKVVPNGDRISFNQAFQIEVKVKNEGSESIKGVSLALAQNPDTLAHLAASPVNVPGVIAGGDTGSAVFDLNAFARLGTAGFKSTIVQATGVNSGQPVTDILDPGQNDSTFAVFESAAEVVVDTVITSVTEINAGDRHSVWSISAILTNTGSADLELFDVNAGNVVFTIGGQVDSEYKISPPTEFEHSGNLILSGGATDTLRYIVTRNGEIAGQATITLTIKGHDRNIGESSIITRSGTTHVSVNTEALAQIVRTTISGGATDNNGNGMINRGSNFQVNVLVRAGELLGVDSVKVELTSDGNSMAKPDTVTIRHIDKDSRETAVFNIKADETWPGAQGEKREKYFAKILSAISASSLLPAQIRQPERAEDSLAVLRIQNPADLELSLLTAQPADTVLTRNQAFTVIARVENKGTAWVDSGKIKLSLPDGYQFVSGESSEKPFAILDDSSSVEVEFSLQAPSDTTAKVAIEGQISQTPKDLNAHTPAKITRGNAQLDVKTVASNLQILSFAISDPPGARDSTLSTGQPFTLKAVIQATKNLRNRSASLKMPSNLGSGKEYTTIESLEKDIVNNPDTLFWHINAPAKEILFTRDFSLTVQAEEIDGTPMVVHKSFTVNKVENHATLSLEDLTVSSPASVMQGDEAYVSINQTFTLKARVRKSGANVTGTGKVTLDFLGSNFKLIDGSTLEQNYTVDTDITWRIQAPNKVITSHVIQVTLLDSLPKDVNSNLPADVIDDAKELTFHVQNTGLVRIDSVWISDPPGARDQKVSTDQQFRFSAKFSSERTSDIRARIHFSSESFNVVNRDIGNLPDDNVNTRVDWNVTSPSDAGLLADSIWIEILANDKYSGAPFSVYSDTIQVWTEDKTVFSIEPEISYPAGLNANRQVSTDQAFHLTAKIKKQGAAFVREDSFVVELIRVPENYWMQGERSITVRGDSMLAGIYPTWQFRAPSIRPGGLSEFVFSLKEVPRDSNSMKAAAIKDKEVSLSLQTVNKTQLALRASLNDESKIDSGSVRIGSHFQVTSSLENFGDAAFVGNYQVEMKLPESGLYTTSDTLIKSGDSKSLSWMITAPKKVISKPDTIVLKLTKPPQDEYAKTKAAVVDSIAMIRVTTEAGVLIAKPYTVQTKSAVLKGGSDVPVLGLEMRNKDLATSTRSILEGIQLTMRDQKRNPISPASVITRIAAVRRSDYSHVFAEKSVFSGAQIFLDFVPPDTVKGAHPDSIDIVVDIASGAKDINFQVAIDSASAFKAHDISGDSLVIADSTQRPATFLGIASRFSVVVENDLKKTFYNYPNPFGRSDRPETKFIYILKKPSDVTIKIFTLTGDLVRTLKYNKSQHPAQTSEGLHQGEITWNGTNGLGLKVMNGVYLAYIITDYGETAMTKIAVVK